MDFILIRLNIDLLRLIDFLLFEKYKIVSYFANLKTH